MEARDVCGGQEALPVPVCGGQEALPVPVCGGQEALPVPVCGGQEALPVPVCGGQEALPVPVCGGQEALPPRFQYSAELVAGPGAELDPSEVTVQGCECQEPHCTPGECACLPHGENYCHHRLLSAQKPVLECNVLCRCGDSCANRETQRGLQYQLHVRPVPGKGWGLCTLESVPSGRFVCEYAGEVLGPEEARRRIRVQDPESNNYIIAVREHLHSGHVLETFVDPTYVGNIGRFLNHSCQPNLVMVPIRTHSMVPRLALFAARDIQAGEELCYDYSGMAFNFTPDSERQSGRRHGTESSGSQRKKCLCGTAPCSGYLPYDATLYKTVT